MMTFTKDIVIGLEIHVELNTSTKLFCGCATHGSEEPNTRTCQVCLGHPGSKPVLNKKVLEFATKLCLALNCEIAPELIFSRKSYFYPDLAKNYQITQYELPLGSNGRLAVEEESVGITRIHIEEDPASLIHPSGAQDSAYVLIDYNRSGNPLLEIVTEPQMHSPDMARDFLKKLITILHYLEIFDENTGVIKADANVSVKESNYTRVEVKNITGFKEIERALNYEITRQRKDVADGQHIVMSTRGWDADKGVTYLLRKKESDEDYGYILDPDLVPIDVSEDYVATIAASMPELADEKLKKFKAGGIEGTTAEVLSKDKDLAAMFEAVSTAVDSSLAAKWIRRELPRVLNYTKKSLADSGITAAHMIALLQLLADKKITDKVGQQLIEKLGDAPFDVAAYVESEGLGSISDDSVIDSAVDEAIAANQKAVDEYKSGKENALNFIVGQVMRATKGKADPGTVKQKVLAKI